MDGPSTGLLGLGCVMARWFGRDKSRSKGTDRGSGVEGDDRTIPPDPIARRADAKDHDHERCMNCQTPLEGPFCHVCGQRDDDYRRPFVALSNEFVADVFQWDSRILRSVPMLLLAPGTMTRAFMQGRRGVFVTPLRLYFVVSLLFFLSLAFSDVAILKLEVEGLTNALESAVENGQIQRGDEEADAIETPASPPVPPIPQRPERPGAADGAVTPLPSPSDTTQNETSEETRTDDDVETMIETGTAWLLEQLGDEAGSLSADVEGQVREAWAEARERIREAQEEAQQAVAQSRDRLREEAAVMTGGVTVMDGVLLGPDPRPDVAGKPLPPAAGISDEGVRLDRISVRMFAPINPDEVPSEQLSEDLIARVLQDASEEDAKAGARALRIVNVVISDPRIFNDIMNEWLPRLMVFLVPFFAWVMSIIYGRRRGLRRRVYFIDHLVFSLHFHAFMFALMTILVLKARYVGDIIDGTMTGLFFLGAITLYLFVALKRIYEQGYFKTTVKFILVVTFLNITYLLSLISITGYALWNLKTPI